MTVLLASRATLTSLLAASLMTACSRAPQTTPQGATTDAPARRACADGMIHVPGGTFMMGAEPGEAFLEDESPAHRVTLSPYCIDRTEVTAEAYARCAAPGCAAPQAEIGPHCSKVARHPRHPRNCVTWDQAVAFCAWRGGRLPTEAEWEFAARGPQSFSYPWGNAPPEPARARYGVAVYTEFPGTMPVGSLPAGRSPFGLDDMAGNVSEWVADWLANYQPSSHTDPRGPPSGSLRVTKGGAFDADSDRSLRAHTRVSGEPTRYGYPTGFRCAASPVNVD